MADEDDIAALVIDNGSGMCKGGFNLGFDLGAAMMWRVRGGRAWARCPGGAHWRSVVHWGAGRPQGPRS